MRQRDDTQSQRALEQIVELVGAKSFAMNQSVERLISELNRLSDTAQQPSDESEGGGGSGTGTGTSSATTSSTAAASSNASDAVTSTAVKREMFLRRLQIALSDGTVDALHPIIVDKHSTPPATDSAAVKTAKEMTDRAKAVAAEINRLPTNQQVC